MVLLLAALSAWWLEERPQEGCWWEEEQLAVLAALVCWGPPGAHGCRVLQKRALQAALEGCMPRLRQTWLVALRPLMVAVMGATTVVTHAAQQTFSQL